MRAITRPSRRKDANYLSAYRRHAEGCSETNDLNCECPLWVQGRLAGKYVRESLNTRSLPIAQSTMKDMLNPPGPGGPGGPQSVPTVGEAVSLEYAEAKFKEHTKGKAFNTILLYSKAVAHFRRFAEAHGVITLREVTPPLIQQYFMEHGAAWKQRSKATRLTHLRVWFNWCKEMDWIAVSPAAKKALSFKKPAGHARKAFSRDEIGKILAAVERLPEADRDQGRALILLLLYSGMRISDVTFLQRRSISRAGILDYTVIKTKKPIGLPIELHKSVIAALKKLPGSGDFFFLPEGDYRAAIHALAEGLNFADYLPKRFYLREIENATKKVLRVLKLAGLPGACHRFRDTFAINMLVGGTDIYTVSQALGHSDVKITSQHYLNLVPGYRERMSQSTRVLNYQLPKAG